MTDAAPIDETDPHELLRRRIEADALVLSRAAARLRWLGWLWFFILAVVFILTMVIVGQGRLQALFAGFIAGFILVGISLFYFALASYVAKGHRWAIGIALFLVSVMVTLLLWGIFTPQPMHLIVAVVKTMCLLSALGMFKSLLQSWGAARRLQRLIQQQVVEEYEMVED